MEEAALGLSAGQFAGKNVTTLENKETKNTKIKHG